MGTQCNFVYLVDVLLSSCSDSMVAPICNKLNFQTEILHLYFLSFDLQMMYYHRWKKSFMFQQFLLPLFSPYNHYPCNHALIFKSGAILLCVTFYFQGVTPGISLAVHVTTTKMFINLYFLEGAFS